MTSAALRIIERVVKRRYEVGEDIDEVLAEYGKLTEEEKAKIKAEVTGNGGGNI